MRKIAIFVEGQTELIAVRELLKRKYCYEVNLDCWTLFREGNLKPVEHEFKNPSAQIYYQIINVNNDQRVLSAILERENSLFLQGFEKIVGLRDMYCSVYKEKSKEIDPELNQKFIDISESTIKDKSVNFNKIFLCFSIMEIEAWFIALYKALEKFNSELSLEKIREKLGHDLSSLDPETTIFNPASFLAAIFGIQNLRYSKCKGDIEAISNCLNKEDYEELLRSPFCASFNKFYELI